MLMKVIEGEIKFSTERGMQHDFSFHIGIAGRIHSDRSIKVRTLEHKMIRSPKEFGKRARPTGGIPFS